MTDTNRTTRLLSLQAENVMRLKAVQLDFNPDGELKIIGGENGQGKSAALNAVGLALGGAEYAKRAGIDEPVRRGEEKATVVVDLDSIKVVRYWTADGKTDLKVLGKDGRPYPAPQTKLTALFGELGFDPLAFLEMDDKQQAQTLSALVGLDFSQADANRKSLFEERRLVGQGVKSLKGQLDGFWPKVGAPDKEVSVAALLDQVDAAGKVNRANAEIRTQLRREVADRDDLTSRIDEAEKQLEQLRLALRNQTEIVQNRTSQVEALEDTDTAPLREQIATAEQTNTNVRQNQARAEIEERHQTAKAEYDDLTKRIDTIDAKKEADLAAAKFPVDGLGFNEDGKVTLFGNLFKQEGSAERLRVSVAMGLAMNQDLNLLLIDDGERLDKHSLKILADMAAEAGAAVLMACVTDDPEKCSCIIVDGEIVEAPEPVGAATE